VIDGIRIASLGLHQLRSRITILPQVGCFSLATYDTIQPRVGFGAHVCYHCRISPPRFLAECRNRRLNQDTFVLLYFRLYALFDLYLYVYFLVLYLYLVSECLFSCTPLFVSISRVIGCEDRLRNVGGALNSAHSLTHDTIQYVIGARKLADYCQFCLAHKN